jgi:hypothetical protein
MRAKIAYKLKGVGKKKPIVEGISGEDLHRDSGKWMYKERVIDHEKNRYKEVVTDLETGNIVHNCEEPLDKHTGHGSAKKGKKSCFH